MKVRVEKDFLNMKKGLEFETNMHPITYGLIELGILSEVKQPKTFKEKLQNMFDSERGMYRSGADWEKAVIEIIDGMAKEDRLARFDKAYISMADDISEIEDCKKSPLYKVIRKALELD